MKISEIHLYQTGFLIFKRPPVDTKTGTIYRRIQIISNTHFIFMDESNLPQTILLWDKMISHENSPFSIQTSPL
jgi:hypothetical protein